MKIRLTFSLLIFCATFFFTACQPEQHVSAYKIIPEPQEIELTRASISLSDTSGLINTSIIDGSVKGGPEGYELNIKPGQSVKALTFREGKPFGFMAVLNDIPNKATGKKVKYNTHWEGSYAANKEESLTDAQLATKRGDHPNWQGFKSVNLDLSMEWNLRIYWN